MPPATPALVRKQIAERTPAPLYLFVGDDEAETSRLAGDMIALVEDELRAFNTERVYAGEKGVTPASIAESARMLPMMSDRRLVVVLRAERILKPKRRGKPEEEAEEDDGNEGADAPADADPLDAYIRKPEPQTTLVFVASDVDKGRKLYKALAKHATIVECWGLKGFADNPKKIKGFEYEKIAREAAALVQRSVREAGKTIDPAAARLIAQRAGTDIVTLRGDVERLLLFVGGRSSIDMGDVQAVVSGETLQNQWALTDAIVRKDTRRALRQLGLAFEAGSVPYMILGQLGFCVRDQVGGADPRRIPAAVEALFRTDLELKSSSGDPRVLLERLVVELCGG